MKRECSPQRGHFNLLEGSSGACELVFFWDGTGIHVLTGIGVCPWEEAGGAEALADEGTGGGAPPSSCTDTLADGSSLGVDPGGPEPLPEGDAGGTCSGGMKREALSLSRPMAAATTPKALLSVSSLISSSSS